MIPAVWVPDLETWLLAMLFVFGVGGLLVMAVGAIQIIIRERQLDRAREAGRASSFDGSYPGRRVS